MHPAESVFHLFALRQSRGPGGISLLGAQAWDLPAADEPEKAASPQSPGRQAGSECLSALMESTRIEWLQLELLGRRAVK